MDMDLFASLFSKEIKKYALFNACNQIRLTEVSPSKYFKLIEKELLYEK
jgi:hypothetical protein